ncbi:MAG: tetratricopeptide repeat protein [Acidobacteriota bacterium]|nr:MAG: tetratricopeptide repeat protein [Acidobacteriota bacterium]
MKRLNILLILLILSFEFVRAQDPVKVAPDAYRTEFENNYVKVQRVHYAPRVKLPEHDHTFFATAYVYLNDAGPVVYKHIGLSYGAVTRPPVKAGSFRLYKAVKETHAVESLSDVPSDFLRVEFKTRPATDQNTLRGKYFREDHPAGENFRKVQFENEQVRITRLICAAGKSCQFATGDREPALIVTLSTAGFKSAGGRIDLAEGKTYWLEAGKREDWLNSGGAEAELLRFDFKTEPMRNARTANAPSHAHDPAPVDASATESLDHLRRGAALESGGKIEESIAEHEKAVELDPGLLQAHVNLISLYGRTGQSGKAEMHYRQALEINPEIPVLHYNYGVLLAGDRRMAEAAESFRTCLRFDPYHADAHHNLGVILESEGKLDEAAVHHRKAIENREGYRSAHFHLGRILVNQGKLTEAIEQFQKTLSPDDEETPRNMYALGATFIRAGDRLNGIKYLKEALKRASALNQTQLVNSIESALKMLEQ